MQSLSVVIITFNEEKNIGDCIRSVANLAEEILVLDSGSTDRTVEIARDLGAKVFTHKFDGHIQQKNRAMAMAEGAWILSLDADERVSPELVSSVKAALENPQSIGYTMNRLNHFEGFAVKTCGWYPDKKLRLWKAGSGEWTGINPHDRFELYGTSKPSHLKGDLLHFTYPDRNSMKRQVQKFAEISAGEFRAEPTYYLLFKMAFSPVFKFIKTYIFQMGFSDKNGLFICSQQAREVYLKYFWAIGLKRQ